MTTEIIFSPHTGTLSAGDKQIILTDQGRRCLTYFCLNEGLLISKETFTQECWGSRGIVVSDTTVRQTVFRLRRSFSELGLSDDILQTKGKSGYLLKPGMIVIDDIQENQDVGSTPCETVDVPEKKETSAEQNEKRFTLSRYITRKSLLILLFMVLCAGGGYYFRLNDMITTINYDFSHEVLGRKYYVSTMVNTEQAKGATARAAFWLQKENVAVDISRFVYINGVLGSYTFALYCTAPINEAGAGCHTLTILGNIHS